MQKLISNKIILIILAIAILLRVVDLNKNSLYGDELTIALDSYSLLKTGHDQLGNLFPLTFPMGAGRPAGYVYGSVPFIAIFGSSAFGVRMLSVISGIGIVLLLFFIGRKLLSKRAGIIAAGLGAVSLWDISLSRGGYEAHFALLLTLLGFYLFLMGNKKPLSYFFSAMSFGLVLHTYPTYKVTLLLFIPLLFWYLKFQVKKIDKYRVAAVLTLVFWGILAISQAITGGSEGRFFNINILSQKELRATIEQKINTERNLSQLPDPFIKVFHNKPVEYIKVFIENYLNNFSLDFLVIHGDRGPRHNMATMGQIYVAEAILIIIGVLSFWHKEKRLIGFLILWILLAPVPTAIVGSPHALRSLLMLPPLILLSVLGFMTILNLKNRIPLFIINSLFLIQFIFFIQKLYFLAPNEYSNFWSYSAKHASEFVKENKEKFSYVILSDKIVDVEYAYPVYAELDPAEVIRQNQDKTIIGKFIFKKFANVYIGDITSNKFIDLLPSLSGSVLYVGTPEDVSNFPSYETLDGINNKPSIGLIKLVN